MKIKAKAIEECATLFEIEISNETINKAFEEVYGEMTKYANIPGFRTGKAPLELVKKHYANNAKEEVLKRLIPDAYKNALEEHKVSPIGMPEISDVSFEDGKPLFFKARVDTRPKFKLKNYKGISLEKKKVAINDEDVEKALQNLREMAAKYVAVEGRPAQMEDYVVSDLECFVDGKPIHKKRENLWLYMDKESMMSGLHEKMVGMNKGEARDVEVKLPEKYPDKVLAGKLATYHVLAKEIKARELPKVDDELAKDLGQKSLDDLKIHIRQELEARSKINTEVETENQLMAKLTDDNAFGVPPGFVKRQLDFMVEESKARLQEKGFKKEDLDKKDNEFREKFKNDAIRQVRLLFILDDIARLEKIEVGDSDLEQAYKAIAAQHGKTEKEVKDYYAKEDIEDNLKEKLREGKVIQFLMKNANITEK